MLKLISLIAVILIAVLLLLLLSQAGSFLVVDNPQHSDAIVILEGSGNTPGYARALDLQRDGYAPKVFLDASVTEAIYAHLEAELAKQFLDRNSDRTTEICPTMGDSLFTEVVDVQRCLNRIGARSAILMTSDFETRRSLSIFRARLPQYRWSVAAASTPYHSAEAYWKHRGWAKTVVEEWEQFLWWKLFDQRRSDVVLRSG